MTTRTKISWTLLAAFIASFIATFATARHPTLSVACMIATVVIGAAALSLAPPPPPRISRSRQLLAEAAAIIESEYPASDERYQTAIKIRNFLKK